MRKRILLSLILAAVVLLIMCQCAGRGEDTTYQTYYVQSGDTMWSIAKKYKGENENMWEYIYEVMDLNGIDGGILHCGAELIIPVRCER